MEKVYIEKREFFIDGQKLTDEIRREYIEGKRTGGKVVVCKMTAGVDEYDLPYVQDRETYFDAVAKSTCHDEDKFDIKIGMAIASARAQMAISKKIVKRYIKERDGIVANYEKILKESRELGLKQEAFLDDHDAL